MSKVCIFLADGFEEIEGLTVVDMLRRADIEISMVSVTGSLNIRGSHDICLSADVLFEDADFSDTEMFILPGGMPGTLNLKAHEALCALLKSACQNDKYVAAICAAPIVLGSLGILEGKKATCYPAADLEAQLTGAEHLSVPVVTDGKIITSRGMGTAIEFAAVLIEKLKGQETADALLQSIVYRVG